MPSFTHLERFPTPNNRSKLVSFSVNSSSGEPPEYSHGLPKLGCFSSMAPVTWRITGRVESPLQVLRNQIVGNTRKRAVSGPRLETLIFMKMSSTSHFEYLTNMSK